MQRDNTHPYYRFRANPEKVRVSIRREGEYWRVEVAQRDGSVDGGVNGLFGTYVLHLAKKPVQGLQRALKLAEAAGIEGVDRGMQWTYFHPQHPPAFGGGEEQ